MHVFGPYAALLAQAVPVVIQSAPKPFLPETLVEWSQAVTPLLAVGAGVWALFTYRSAQRIKAAEIVLKMEEEFRIILPTYEKIDDARAYRKHLKSVVSWAVRKDDLVKDDIIKDEFQNELRDLTDLDRCLRFFVLCSVLHGLNVENKALRRAYYYHVKQLAEMTDSGSALALEREGFSDFLNTFYPTLCDWAQKNKTELNKLLEQKQSAKTIRSPAPAEKTESGGDAESCAAGTDKG